MKDESGLRTGGGSTVNGAAVQGWVKVSIGVGIVVQLRAGV